MIKILSGSYNKSDYAIRAYNTVIGQTFKDWKLVIMENSTDGITRNKVLEWVKSKNDPRIELQIKDFTPEHRKEKYVVAEFINREYNKRDADHYFWISDDDTMEPTTLEKLLKPQKSVTYAGVACYKDGQLLLFFLKINV